MKRLGLLIALALVVALLASCAPSPNPSASSDDGAAGFWLGLWHGSIALFTFVISLFNKNVSMYEVVNNGGWYNFGFLVGMMVFWGGGGGGAARGSRSR